MYFFTIFPRTLPLLNNDKTSSTLDIVGALDRSLKAMFVNKCLGKCLCNSEKNQQKRRSISKFSEVQSIQLHGQYTLFFAVFNAKKTTCLPLPN